MSFAQQNRYLAQNMRPTQSRMERSASVMAGSGSGQENPLIAHFANDKVIKELEIDTAAIKNVIWERFGPCCWPFYKCNESMVANAAAARRLTLRENSLEYSVDKYQSGGTYNPDSYTCGCMPFDYDGGPLHLVVPISDVTDAYVRQREVCAPPPDGATRCGVEHFPDTLVVKAKGSNFDWAVDAPVEGSVFCDLVLAQARRIRESVGTPLPPGVTEAYGQFVSSALPGGLLGGVIGRMAGFGGPSPVPVQHQPQAQPAPPAPDLPAQLQKLIELRDSGALTEEEFATAKAKALAAS